MCYCQRYIFLPTNLISLDISTTKNLQSHFTQLLNRHLDNSATCEFVNSIIFQMEYCAKIPETERTIYVRWLVGITLHSLIWLLSKYRIYGPSTRFENFFSRQIHTLRNYQDVYLTNGSKCIFKFVVAKIF